jgi:hypothetical protein
LIVDQVHVRGDSKKPIFDIFRTLFAQDCLYGVRLEDQNRVKLNRYKIVFVGADLDAKTDRFPKNQHDAPHKDNSEHKEFLQSYRFLCIILIDSQDATNQNGDLNQTQPIKEISTAPGPQLPQDGLYRRRFTARSSFDRRRLKSRGSDRKKGVGKIGKQTFLVSIDATT